MSDFKGDLQTAYEAGVAQGDADLKVIEIEAPGGVEIPIVLVNSEEGEQLQVPDRALKLSLQLADQPQRMRGIATHQELASFIAHVKRFKDESSTVWADVDAVSLLAVYNYAGNQEAPRWGDHGAKYICPLSREWRTWLAQNGKPMGHDDFAEFLEANSSDLASAEDGPWPEPVRLLEIARTLRIHSKSTFERDINKTTGEYSVIAKVENEATSTKIPPSFIIGIPVFEAGDPYRIEARLRFTVHENRPKFSYHLVQPENIKSDAFNEVRAQVAEKTGLPVLAGQPEPPPSISI